MRRAAGRGATIVTLLIWVLIVFNVIPEGFQFGGGVDMPTRGSTVSRLIWIALLATSALVVARNFAVARVVLRSFNPFLLAIGLLATLSLFWSIDPALTLRRLIRFLAVLSCAFALVVAGWHYHRFQSLLRPILTTLVVGSILFTLLWPVLGIEQSTQASLVGAWRGLTTHKNALGALASLATIFWVHALLTRETRPWIGLPALAASMAVLYLSRSSTSIIATWVAIVVIIVVLHTPREGRRVLPIFVSVMIALVLLYSLAILQLVPGLGWILKPITALTGKDLTFTGRTELWEIIRERIADHPWLGGGFGAYWAGPIPGKQSYEFILRLYFYPGQAHNGYLDVINDLGRAGGVLLVGYLVWFVGQGLRLMRLDHRQGALYLALIFQQLISNLSEARWLNVLSVEFVIITLATAAIARDLIEARLRAAALRRPAPAPNPMEWSPIVRSG